MLDFRHRMLQASDLDMAIDRKLLLAAGLGGLVGVSIVAVATNAIPKAMGRLMSDMMENMDDGDLDYCKQMLEGR